MAYGVKYILNTCDVFDNPLKVEIQKKNYSSGVINYSAGETPVRISYKNENDTKTNSISGSTAELSLITSETLSAGDFQSALPDDYLIKIYRSNSLFWSGFLSPGDISAPYMEAPEEIKIQGTDMLAALKDVPFRKDTAIESLLSILSRCLSLTGLSLQLDVQVNTFEAGMSQTESPLSQVYIDVSRFKDSNGKWISCYEVIKAIAAQFTATLRQDSGVWKLVNPIEAGLNAPIYRYGETGMFVSKSTPTSTVKTAGCKKDNYIILADGSTGLDKGAGKTAAYWQLSYGANKLANGDFTELGGGGQEPFAGWRINNVDGIGKFTARRFQALNTATGLLEDTIPADYGLFIKEPNGYNYITSPQVALRAEDSEVSIAFRVTLAESTTAQQRQFSLYIFFQVIYVGNNGKTYYWQQKGNNWTESQSWASVSAATGDVESKQAYFTLNKDQISTPPNSIGGTSIKPGFLYIRFSGASFGISLNANSVAAVILDDVQLSVTENTYFPSPKGWVSEATNNKAFTYSPDVQTLMFGDGSSIIRNDWLRKSDNTPTAKWRRYGASYDLSIVQAAALNQMALYQSNGVLLDMDLYGNGLNVSNLLSIRDFAGKTFFIQSGELDLRECTFTITAFELFTATPAGAVPSLFADYGTYTNSEGNSVGSAPSGIAGSGGGSQGAVTPGYSPENQSTLDKLSDDNGYLKISGTKVKAGEADHAATADHADEADHAADATLWNGKTQTDYLTQPVRPQDSPAFAGISSETFVSGATGSGYRIWKDTSGKTNLELDNISVRNSLAAREFVIEKIRASNGAIAVTDGAKVSKVIEAPNNWGLFIDTSDGTIAPPFVAGDWVRCQQWNGKGIKHYEGRVQIVTNEAFLIDKATMVGGGIPEVGDDVVRFGSSVAGRQGLLYLTSNGPGAPYLDVLDGVTNSDLTDKTKVRLGLLSGIVSPTFGQLNGHGLYGRYVYLENAFISGALYAGVGSNVPTKTELEQAKTDLTDTINADIDTKIAAAQLSQGSLVTIDPADWEQGGFDSLDGFDGINNATDRIRYKIRGFDIPQNVKITFDDANFIVGAYFGSGNPKTIDFTSSPGLITGRQKMAIVIAKKNTTLPISPAEIANTWLKVEQDLSAEIIAAKTAAEAAKQEASTATQNVGTLTTELGKLSDDGVLKPFEKPTLATLFADWKAKYTADVAQANKYNVSSADYTAKYNTLNSYLTPILADMTTPTTIDRTVYETNTTDFLNAQVALLNAIATAAQQDVVNKVNAIQIGTENYLTSSEDICDVITGVDTGIGWSISTDPKLGRVAAFTRAAGGGNFVALGNTSMKAFPPGSPITINVLATSDNPGRIQVYYNSEVGYVDTQPQLSTVAYTVVSCTIFPSDINPALHLGLSGINGNVWIKSIWITPGNKATVSWTPSVAATKAQIASAKTAADTARGIADTATQNIASLQTALDVIVDDNVLNNSEKSTVQILWNDIQSDYSADIAEAAKYPAVSTSDYTAKYNSLSAYITPILSAVGNSTIVAATFKANFRAVTEARATVRQNIATAIKTISDNLTTNYGTLNSQLTTAQQDLGTLKTTVDRVTSDNWLDISEKPAELKAWQTIQGEYPRIIAQAGVFSVNTADYAAKYNSISSYITPLLADIAVDSAIIGSEYRAKFVDYGNAKVALLRDITSASAQNTTDKINDLKIGGVNLIYNSNFYSQAAGWGVNGGTMSYGRDNGIGDTYANVSGTNGNGVYQTVVLTPNTSYTLSAYVFLFNTYNASNLLFRAEGVFDNTPVDPNKKEQWQKISTTFNSGARASAAITFYLNAPGDVSFTRIQLEEGNKITSWRPSIADQQAYADAKAAEEAQKVKDALNITLDAQDKIIKEMQPTTTLFNNMFTGAIINAAPGLITGNTLIVGDPGTGAEWAGLSGIADRGEQSVWLWGGGTFANRYTARSRFYKNGDVSLSGEFIVRYDSGMPAIRMGVVNGEPAINFYNTDGLKVWEGGRNGIVYVTVIDESIYRRDLTNVFAGTETAPPTHITIDVNAAGTVIANTVSYYYSAGTNPQSASNKIYEGYHKTDQKTSAWIDSAWYVEAGTMPFDPEDGSDPVLAVLYIKNGNVTQTQSIACTIRQA